jgi:hypothetical protein
MPPACSELPGGIDSGRQRISAGPASRRSGDSSLDPEAESRRDQLLCPDTDAPWEHGAIPLLCAHDCCAGSSNGPAARLGRGAASADRTDRPRGDRCQRLSAAGGGSRRRHTMRREPRRGAARGRSQRWRPPRQKVTTTPWRGCGSRDVAKRQGAKSPRRGLPVLMREEHAVRASRSHERASVRRRHGPRSDRTPQEGHDQGNGTGPYTRFAQDDTKSGPVRT